MPKESYHEQILNNLRAGKELAENLLLLIELDDDISDESESMASDSDNDSLIFLLNDEMADEDLQNAEGKRYLKECGSYMKHRHNVFVQDLDDSVGCWLSDYKFKMRY